MSAKPDFTLSVDRYIEVLNNLTRNNIHSVDSIYAPGLRFQDPVHRLAGLEPFRAYLAGLYQHVVHCHFEIRHRALSGDTAFLAWTMELRHARFRPAETLRLDGMSMLVFQEDGLIVVHEDAFDLGAMIYERVPVIGAINKRIKKGLQ